MDALYDEKDNINVFNARHEAGAANMAESYGKLTGKPGIAFVTRGPGACHASVGVHIAFQDSTPMILFVGSVSRDVKDREAFQEVNFKTFFSPMSKWVGEIEDPNRIPEYINRAFNTSVEGRPGPVVLVLPEDMLIQCTNTKPRPYFPISRSAFPGEHLNAIKNEFDKSEKPLVIVGGSGWTDESCKSLEKFATNNCIPFATSFRRQDLFNHKNQNFVGSFGTSVSPSLAAKVKESDLIMVIGARLGEMTTQSYTLINPEDVRTKNIIHIHADPNEINKIFNPILSFSVSPVEFSHSLKNIRWFNNPSWKIWRDQLRYELKNDLKPLEVGQKNDLSEIFISVEEHLPEDSVITLDAGNNAAWPQRFLSYGRPRRQIASTCGSMGYAIPAAISSAIVFPEKTILCCVGDGGFMMTSHELSTAVQYGLCPIILLINNQSYGTIRMHQERDYPGRNIATDLKNPDFIALSKSLGADAFRIESEQEFSNIFFQALQSKRLTVIEIPISINQLSHRVTLN
jgi:acetolactate synthase-1/2/3 large subunit